MKMSNNPAKYVVLIKQYMYLHSILDVSESPMIINGQHIFWKFISDLQSFP